MKQRVFVAVVTALVFCAGFLAGLYTDQHRPLPGPPVTFLGEFAPPKSPADTAVHHEAKPPDRAQIVAQVQSLLPQLEAFRQHSSEITAQFEREFDEILTPDQRVVHAKEMANGEKHRRDNSLRTEPLTDDEFTNLTRDQPAHYIYSFVVIPGVLDDRTKKYSLDPTQREQVRALLKTRRERFLELVDSSPPPSVVLGRLAPLMARLAQPGPSAAAPIPLPPPSPALSAPSSP